MILKLWKTTREAKKKQLVEHQGLVTGTPETSDDEDEEDDVHDSTFCPVQHQRNSWMVSPNERNSQNFYQNDPAPQFMVPHKLTTYIKPHEKSRSSEGRYVRTEQEQINYPVLRMKDKEITATQHVRKGKVKFNARTNLGHSRRLDQYYMENEDFFSRYSYGGGKERKRILTGIMIQMMQKN